MVDTTRVRNLVGTNRDGVGTSPRRPDGVSKVTGEFAYSSDMWMEDMLWGATLRSPHPHARIRGIDVTEALKVPGVHAVLTHEDVPGEKRYGLEYRDQPVLAIDKVRYQGSPWPWWPPITRRLRVGPWNVSGWIMRCWSRSVMRVGPPWTPTVRRCTSRGRSPPTRVQPARESAASSADPYRCLCRCGRVRRT